MLVETLLPSAIHGIVLALLSWKLLCVLKERNGFPGTTFKENGCHQSSTREELVVEMRKGPKFLLTKELRMYVTQTKMIFLMKSHMN